MNSISVIGVYLEVRDFKKMTNSSGEEKVRKKIEELERKIAVLEKKQAALAKRIDEHIKTTTLNPEKLFDL